MVAAGLSSHLLLGRQANGQRCWLVHIPVSVLSLSLSLSLPLSLSLSLSLSLFFSLSPSARACYCAPLRSVTLSYALLCSLLLALAYALVCIGLG